MILFLQQLWTPLIVLRLRFLFRLLPSVFLMLFFFFLFNFFTVSSFQGEVLKLTKITRSEMGAYLCIASNGIPPSVSKRIMVNVHCKYINLYIDLGTARSRLEFVVFFSPFLSSAIPSRLPPSPGSSLSPLLFTPRLHEVR